MGIGKKQRNKSQNTHTDLFQTQWIWCIPKNIGNPYYEPLP